MVESVAVYRPRDLEMDKVAKKMRDETRCF